MSLVDYRFFSIPEYSTVTFNGLYITLKELKKLIMVREHLRATDCDLQITNAQTREEYTDDEAEIPGLSSVIVHRVPVGGVAPPGNTFNIHRSLAAMISSSRPTANASEDDEIEVLMSQSNYGYASTNHSKKAVGSPPANCVCCHCGKAGHHILECPLLFDKSVEGPLVPHDQSSSEDDSDPIPDERMCPICNDLMTDAEVTPCGGNSYCDNCIRLLLLYPCQYSVDSSDDLIANNFLRQVQTPAPSPPAPVADHMHSTCQGEPPSPGSFTGIKHPPPAHGYIAPPPGPPPPVYPSPYPYPPPPQPYPSPYTSGFITPSPISYPPQPIYAPVSPGLNPPWIPPGVQPPLPHLGPPLSQPPLSKEECYVQRHRQEKTTSKLDEFTNDFLREMMRYKNSPKRQRPSYSRYRSRSRSPFSRSPYTRSRSRSRSRTYSYSPSRSRSCSRSHGRSNRRSPDSRHNGRSDRRSRSRSHSLFPPPPPLRARPWEGAEGPAPFRSRSRSPGGFRNRSPGGRKPPPRELPSYELKLPSPGGHDRWERERYRQWEKQYTDWYNKHYKDYDNQHPSHQRGRGSRDRQKDRMSPLPRDYSPQRRGKRGREEEGAPPHQPPSKKSSTKVLKTETVNKKRPREEPEPSNYSEDSDDATPLRDEPMLKRMYPGPSLRK